MAADVIRHGGSRAAGLQSPLPAKQGAPVVCPPVLAALAAQDVEISRPSTSAGFSSVDADRASLRSPSRLRRGSAEDAVPPSPRPAAAFRRKIVCNWGGVVGQPNLLSVATGMEQPIKSPYRVTIRYDLRGVPAALRGEGGQPHLAALDAEKLRRKGCGAGLDALQASDNWIARDCLCTKGHKLKALGSWSFPGEINVSLLPVTSTDQGEAIVLFRVIVVRAAQDQKDWRALGAPLVMRMELGGARKLQAADMPRQFAWVRSPRGPSLSPEPPRRPDENKPEFWGVRLQQVIDFYASVEEDMDRYCAAHLICTEEGKYRGHHVCLHDPCPFRPINKARYDDHRGVPFVTMASLTAACGSDDAAGGPRPPGARDMVPSTQLLVDRYIKPTTRGTGRNLALTMNSGCPLQASAFVTHVWTEPFRDLLDTLQVALDPREVVFMCCFALDHHAQAPDGRPNNVWLPRASDVSMRPSFQALRRAEKLVIAVDRDFTLLERVWCDLEICKAREWRVPAFFWPHRDIDLSRLEIAVSEFNLHSIAFNADANGDQVLREALEESLLTAELQPSFKSKWEKQQEADGVALRDQRFQRFIGDRIRSFAGALRSVADLQDFSPEQLRQLHAEQERRVSVDTAFREHKQRAEQMHQDLEELRTLIQAREAAHAGEMSSLRRSLVEAERAYQASATSTQMEVRGQMQEKDTEIHRLEELLRAERAKTAQLEEQLEKQTQAASQASERLDMETRRLEQERIKRMDLSFALDKTNRLLLLEQRQREQWENKCEELQNMLLDLSKKSSLTQDSYEEQLRQATEEVQRLRRNMQAEKEQAHRQHEEEEMERAPSSPMVHRAGTSPIFLVSGDDDDREEGAPKLGAEGTQHHLDVDEIQSSSSHASRGISGLISSHRFPTSSSSGVGNITENFKRVCAVTGKLLAPFAGRSSDSPSR